MPRNTSDATLVMVEIAFGGGLLKYGFNSRLREALRDNFGQVPITGATEVTGLVIRANRPKPARASKRTEGTGYEGSFAASAQIATLKADGYKITRPKLTGIRGGDFSQGFYVTMNGVKYGFLSNALGNANGTDAGFPSAFGVEAITPAVADNIVWGADFPKPGVWATSLADGSIFSSLADPTAESNLAGGSARNTKPKIDTLAKFLGI